MVRTCCQLASSMHVALCTIGYRLTGTYTPLQREADNIQPTNLPLNSLRHRVF